MSVPKRGHAGVHLDQVAGILYVVYVREKELIESFVILFYVKVEVCFSEIRRVLGSEKGVVKILLGKVVSYAPVFVRCIVKPLNLLP